MSSDLMDDRADPEQSSELPNYSATNNVRLRGILKLIIISLLFYAANIFVSLSSKIYAISIPIPLLGRLILWPTMIRLRKLNLGWAYYSVVIITPIFCIFDFSVIAGSRFIYYAYFMPVELILILLILKRLIAINYPDSHIIKFISKIVFIEGTLFSISMFLGAAFILIFYFQTRISPNSRALIMTFLSGILPLLLICIAMSVTLIYAIWRIRKHLQAILVESPVDSTFSKAKPMNIHGSDDEI